MGNVANTHLLKRQEKASGHQSSTHKDLSFNSIQKLASCIKELRKKHKDMVTTFTQRTTQYRFSLNRFLGFVKKKEIHGHGFNRI